MSRAESPSRSRGLLIWALLLTMLSTSGWTQCRRIIGFISYIPGLAVQMAPLVLVLVPRCILTSLPCLSSPCLPSSSPGLRSFLRTVVAIFLAHYLPYRTRPELGLRKVFRSLCPRPRLIIMLPRGFAVGQGRILHVLLFHISHVCINSHPLKQSASGTACPYQLPALSSLV